MIVFRWIMGVLLALTAGGSVLCFVLFMALDIEVWIERARSMRRGAYLVALFWFNTEIWGRVILTLIHWH
jgi:hypothetical protein